MKLTKQQEAEILDVYEAYWGSLLNADIELYEALLANDFKLIGTTELEFFSNKNQAVQFLIDTADQVAGNIEKRKSKIKIELVDGLALVTEQFDVYVFTKEGWVFYAKTRGSTWMRKEGEWWKLIQQHISIPDAKVEEGETIALEKISKENLQLRDAVKRRTIELEEKNRELEIETALEKVRASSMAMQSSDELHDVLRILFQQFDVLGINPVTVFISLFSKEERTLTYRSSGKSGKRIHGKQTVSIDSLEVWSELFEKWENDSSDSVEVIYYDKKVLPVLFDLLAEAFSEMPEEERMGPADFPKGGYTMHGYTPFGYIGYNHTTEATEEEKDILTRFATEFGRVYQRFLDIEKAEAQTREAQIEAALERIRAKSMAMQKPDDLNDVLSLLFLQFDILEIKPVNVWLSLLDLEKETFTYRATGTGGSRLHTNQVIDFYAMDIWQEALKQWKTDTPDSVLLTHYPNDIWPQLVEVFSETFMSMPEDERIKREDFPNGLFNVQGYTKFGYLGFNHFREPTNEEKDILRKFAKEFERVYQRFLDIQKAEEQTKEAQIETSLERVRAASMAMHQTEDIGKVVVVFFEQLKQLNIPFEQTWITILKLEEGYFDTWFSPIDGIYNEPTHFKMPSAPFEETAIKSWKSGVPFSYLSLKNKEEVDQFLLACDAITDSTYFSHIQKILKNERLEFLEARHKYGFISKITKDDPTKEDEELLQRFGKVFEQTYTRFLDLQKAEAQAKEAQIEAAIEKVRSRSLAMHKTDELHEVVTVVFEKLQELGVPMDGGAHIAIYNDEIKGMTNWLASPDHISAPMRFSLPYHDDPVLQNFWKAKKTGLGYLSKIYSFEEKNKFFKYIFEDTDYKGLPEEVKNMVSLSQIYSHSTAFAKTSGIAIHSHLGIVLSENEAEILKRFSRVFEQAYIRFMDLQKAEAQAREAQIEAALEKVRSRSLAMQKSDELQEVVRVVAEKITELGVVLEIGGVVICTYPNEGEKDQIHWTASFDPLLPSVPYYLPYFDTPLSVEAWAAKLNGDEYFEKVLTKEENLHFFNLALVHSDYKNLPDAYKTALLACEHHGFSFAIQKNSALMVASIEGKLLNEAHKSILIRFSRVFEQAYIRFMDLQKAEAQAREAQIEAALEKVRSRSLAMHNADELQEVVTVVGEKLQELGVILDSGGVVICTYFPDSKDVMHWTATFDSTHASIPYYLPYFDTPIFIETWDSKNSGADFFEKNYSFEDKNHFFHYAFEHSDYKNLPAEYKQALLDAQSHALSFAWAKNSALMIASHTGMLLPEEHKIILKRFAKVFEQAYIRFMDLQKAEAQAKEAQIETALEKVRSRSMAMHNSKELQQVVNVVYDQLKELGLQMHAAVVTGTIKPKSAYEVWVGGSTFSEPLVIPYTDSTQVQRDYNREIENRPELFCKTYSGEIMKEYFDFLMQENEFPDDLEKLMLECKAFSTTLTFAKNSGMQLVRYSDEPYTDAENKILIRFNKVFEQAYVRFLDLQKAEAQAREAQIEAALEKVRARSMAMQSSTELHEILGILFSQFDNLGIKPVNVFLSLFDREKRTLTYRASGKSGTRIPGMQVVKVDSMEALKALFDKWLTDNSDSVEVIHYPKEVVPQLFGIFAETFAAMPEEDRMGVDDFPDGGYSMAGYTPFGYLGYDHQRQATDEEKDILSRFCIEFTRVYQRFLDIQKAEAQAREAQIEMALERVRSRTMAMHQSQELKEVIYTTFEQMKSLDITINFCAIDIHGENIEDLNLWVAAPDQNYAELQVVPFFDHPLVIQTAAAKKRNDTDFVIHLSEEENRKFYEHIFEHTSFKESMSDERKQMILQTKGQDLIGCCLPQSALFISNFQGYVYTDKERNTLLRFAKVFEQAYTRFLDLQKAEAQARDAQIEMALERVRARSMAMHQTDELSDVLCVLFEQFDFLGINPVLTHLTLMDEANETFTLRITTSPKKRVFAEQKIDINAVESWKASFENWKKGEPNTVDCIDYPPEVLPYVWEVLREVMNALPEGHKINPEDFPDGLYTTQGHFKFGYLGFNHSRRATEEEKSIVSRFATEFGRVYQRFLDIQKAEAQAKESEIQLALERVRARTMAMHNSNELGEVASVLFEQISLLTNTPDRFNIGIANEEDSTFDVWVTDQQGHKISKLFVAATDKSPVIFEVFEAWKRKEDFIVQDLYGEQLEGWLQYMGKELGIPFDKNQVKEHRYINSIFFTHGFIGITTNDLPNPETLKLIERFAKVFQQTYTRFLDLQKAEAQTKDAQIEAALERVRAKAMAMHSSKDIPGATAVVFNELRKLGIEIERCGIFIFYDSPVMEVWSTPLSQEDKQDVEIVTGNLNTDIHPLLRGIYKSWLEKIQYYSYELKGEEVKKYYDLLEKEPGYRFPKIEKYPDRQIINTFSFKEGGIFVFQKDTLSEDSKQILNRFTKVFSLTYGRYLDLQKAETRTREAMIEASLERIRAKAMAMQHTEELNEVIGLLCEQYDILGINPVCAHLALIDVENDRFSLRLTGKKGARNVGEQIIDANAMPVWAEAIEKWKNSEPLSYQCLVYSVDDVPKVLSILNEVISTMPEESRISAADFPEGLFSCEGQNKFGNLGFNHSRPPTEEEIQIVVRFSREFERIYQRFLDLEKAEAQAREAIKQASLERVRGEIASMRSTEDLQRITPLVFNELTTLGVPFIRCGVFIIQEDAENVEVYLSAPDGHSLGVLQLPFHANELTEKAVANWRNKKVYHQHWNKEDFVNWTKSMMEQGQIQNQQTYQGAAAPPESLDLHFIPFEQGMLYVGNVSELNEKEVDLVKALAEAFAIAYFRYEDFVKLEKAKESIELTLSELKSTQSQLIQSEKMASLGELTAGIAHEIQNPLNFVNNFSEVSKELLDEMSVEMEKGNLEDVRDIMKDVIQNLEKINHHGKRADGIVKGMLQHSRSSSGSKEPTDINALADEYLRLAYHGLRAKDKSFNATMKTDFDSSLEKVNVIPQDIGRVILNLITNAFYVVNEKKHELNGDYEPTVTVSTKQLNARPEDPVGRGKVQISVKDNGKGMPDVVKEKVFQPFFTTKPTGKGTGLGLSLAFDIVTKGHGGELKVETKEGEGTEFIIELPNI